MSTIIITGATKGIGRAIANKFASANWNIIVCARNMANLDKMKSDWKTTYPKSNLHIFQADLSEKAQVLHFANFIKSLGLQIDALVNNTGVFLAGNILDKEEGILEHQINTNLYSAFHLSRGIAPMMVAQKSGHIFTICSVASLKAYPGGSNYCISKFALDGFTQCLREEVKGFGVKVTAIYPGATWSDSWAGADLPIERLMPAEDVAESIYMAFHTSTSTVIEKILLRPQLGDLD